MAMSWIARLFGSRRLAAATADDEESDDYLAELVDLAQKIARTQARQGLRLEEIESKLEAGFSDLRGMVEKVDLGSASSLSFDECFDAMDGLEEAARLAPDEAHAQGIRAVSGRLERFLKQAGFERLADVGETPDGHRFRVVGTEDCDALAAGKVLRVVRAAVSRQGNLVREGEVIVSMRST